MNTSKRIQAGIFFLCLPAMTAGLLFAGCKLVGAEPAPPTKFEQTVFDVQTNFVEKVVVKTNTVVVEVPQLVLHTNEVNQVVTQTNFIKLSTDQVVLETNQAPVYTLTPKQVAKDAATTSGTIANLIAPGAGGLVSGIFLAGITLWGKLRSYKRTGGVLAQNIESIREFMKTLPNGQKYDDLVVQYLKDHQGEAGVADNVLTILQQCVSNRDARDVAKEIQTALQSVKS